MSSASAAPSPFLLKTIHGMGDKELDALPYGVIQLDAEGNVLRYNVCEAKLSGLTKQRVVGKNFFKQVAPCTDMKEFHGRFREGIAAGELHCTFRFHFAFKKGPSRRDDHPFLQRSGRDRMGLGPKLRVVALIQDIHGTRRIASAPRIRAVAAVGFDGTAAYPRLTLVPLAHTSPRHHLY